MPVRMRKVRRTPRQCRPLLRPRMPPSLQAVPWRSSQQGAVELLGRGAPWSGERGQECQNVASAAIGNGVADVVALSFITDRPDVGNETERCVVISRFAVRVFTGNHEQRGALDAGQLIGPVERGHEPHEPRQERNVVLVGLVEKPIYAPRIDVRIETICNCPGEKAAQSLLADL